jgi:hypothetical protein
MWLGCCVAADKFIILMSNFKLLLAFMYELQYITYEQTSVDEMQEWAE